MGVFQKISSVFSRGQNGATRRPHDSGEGAPPDPGARRFLTPETPVSVEPPTREDEEDEDLLPVAGGDDADPDAETRALTERRGGRLMGGKAKQELFEELRRNYAEVLELVRKVDGHLDLQQQRSERLLQIAERIPEALATLPELRKQNDRVIDALDRIAETADMQTQYAEGASRNLDRACDHLERGAAAQESLTGSLDEFRTAVHEMSGAQSRVSDTIESVQRNADERAARLAESIERSQRWIIIAVAMSAVGLLGAIALAVVAIMTIGA